MRYVFSVFLFGIFLCSGCAPDSEKHPGTTNTSSLACPSGNFADFLAKFSEDENIQRQWINYPLKYVTWDFLDNGARFDEIVQRLSMEQLKFPLFFISKMEIEESKLILMSEEFSAGGAKELPTGGVIELPVGGAVVTVSASDSGMKAYFFFNAVDGCWKLTEIQDQTTNEF